MPSQKTGHDTLVIAETVNKELAGVFGIC
jgi:hypothetical protein